MSILIKGMEMPDNCHVCVAGYGGCCFVAPAEADGICPDNGRADFCPLIEILKHGRLIDFDRIEAIMKNACDECKESSMEFDGFYADCGQCLLNGVKKDLMFAPTIIPAEEGET